MLRVLWLLLLLWLAQGRELAPQVLTWPAGRCEVLWFQAQQTVAIACPGQDLRQIWPWPAEQPWFEDAAPPELPPAPPPGRGRQADTEITPRSAPHLHTELAPPNPVLIEPSALYGTGAWRVAYAAHPQ